MKTNVTAIFDIGKTNKKFLLFDDKLNVVLQNEVIFKEVPDDDGFACDNIESLEKWIKESINKFLHLEQYDLKAINFATYGATLVYLDKNGKRITSAYNYEKPLSQPVDEKIYNHYGGKTEFCRKTASPALGALNSGFQMLDIKYSKGQKWSEIKTILHFPQYLSYLFTGKITSEHTSIGCHTALWDFDNMKYHKWLEDEDIELPIPSNIKQLVKTEIVGKQIYVGIGVHDSSASIVPYLTGAKKRFVLISTGTWCINMNPFNHSPLTKEELENDCLNFLSINQKPVKSSRLFLGRIHDENVKHLASVYNDSPGFYKDIKLNEELTQQLINKKEIVFFKSGVPSKYVDTSVDYSYFKDINEAYHSLVVSLTQLVAKSVNLVVNSNNEIEHIYITGGFTRNKIFIKSISLLYPDKSVFTSKIDNATALGAAMLMKPDDMIGVDLGLTKV